MSCHQDAGYDRQNDERVQDGDRSTDRIELKDRAESSLMMDVPERAARDGGAVEVAVACLNHVGGWSGTVAAGKSPDKGIQHGEVSRRVDPENSAGTAAGGLAPLSVVP